MAKKTRYIVSRDAFDNPYVFDTKIEITETHTKYTVSWDAFVGRPSLAENKEGQQ